MNKSKFAIAAAIFGFVLLFAGSVSGITPLFYVGLGVVVVGIISVFAVNAIGAARRGSSDEKDKKATKRSVAAIAVLLGVLLCVVGLPMTGMFLMAFDMFGAGLAVFFTGPAILVIIIIVSQVRAKRSANTQSSKYDFDIAPSERVEHEERGVVTVCLEMPNASSEKKFFVRVDCDGTLKSGRSAYMIEKGTEVNVATYADGSVKVFETADSDSADAEHDEYDTIDDDYTDDSEEFDDDEFEDDEESDTDSEELDTDTEENDGETKEREYARPFTSVVRDYAGYKKAYVWEMPDATEEEHQTADAPEAAESVEQNTTVEPIPEATESVERDITAEPIPEAEKIAEVPVPPIVADTAKSESAPVYPEDKEDRVPPIVPPASTPSARPGAHKATVGYKGIKKK
ncbi:MAG: hypothetical protein OSJ83_05585 [Clostridia bacterium]|nr:hypothetical protein [Clostridia bacterium]